MSEIDKHIHLFKDDRAFYRGKNLYDRMETTIIKLCAMKDIEHKRPVYKIAEKRLFELIHAENELNLIKKGTTREQIKEVMQELRTPTDKNSMELLVDNGGEFDEEEISEDEQMVQNKKDEYVKMKNPVIEGFDIPNVELTPIGESLKPLMKESKKIGRPKKK